MKCVIISKTTIYNTYHINKSQEKAEFTFEQLYSSCKTIKKLSIFELRTNHQGEPLHNVQCEIQDLCKTYVILTITTIVAKQTNSPFQFQKMITILLNVYSLRRFGKHWESLCEKKFNNEDMFKVLSEM
jgi:hypothetical protein